VFDTVLVADRGTTALRVVRTCQRLGVQAIAVHGQDDARARHVREADEAVPLGGRTTHETYGDARKLVEAARRSGAQALHPGAGPLALDAGLARAVEEAGLVWLGPAPSALESRPAGAGGHGLTVVLRAVGDDAEVLGCRRRLGTAVEEQLRPEQVPGEVLAAARRAWPAAGTGGLVAVETVGDAPGTLVPGPLVTPASAATEVALGVDLVELELRLAAGEPVGPLPAGRGCVLSLQVRAPVFYAGRLRRFRLPAGGAVRADSDLGERGRLSAHSDRLLAVLTVRGADRPELLEAARSALDEVDIRGVPTNLDLLRAVLADPSFVAGKPDDALLERIPRS